MVRSYLNLLNAHVEIYENDCLVKDYTVRELALKYGREIQDDYDELERVGLIHYKEQTNEKSTNVG